MKQEKKTAGKTATTNTKSLFSLFEESTTKWNPTGNALMLTAAECKLVTECQAKAYYSEDFGMFTKLYITILYKGKVMRLKDNSGHTGIKCDIATSRRLDLEENETMEVDPKKVVVYELTNIEDDTTILKARILK